MKPEIIKNLIIGAGPAGLAVAGRLRKQNIDFEIFEKAKVLASSWYGHYERLHLHTVKKWSHLPHLPFPEHYPTYVSRLDLIKYFENYANVFKIQPQLETEVQSIKKEENYWQVATNKGDFFAENVILATGVNHVPKRPTLKGEENYTGSIIHSKTYKNHKPFLGKKVLIIGFGNTGAEIALDLAEHNIETTISVRNPVTIVPRDINGRPVQVTAKILELIPFGIGDQIGTLIRKMVIGDLSKYGVPLSKVHPAEQLRTTGKTPLIDLGTVEMIKKGRIKVKPDVNYLEGSQVVFKDESSLPIDSIILATGYRSNLTDLIPSIKSELDKFGYPKSPIAQTNENKGLYFVGFDNYKLGGILGTIYNDSETVANHLSKIN